MTNGFEIWQKTKREQRPTFILDEIRCMTHVLTWEVPEEGWRLIEPCLSLPDVNDRHVLAAEHVIGATANVFNQT